MRKKPDFSLGHPCVSIHVPARGKKKREERSEGQKKGEGRERDLAPPHVHEKSWDYWFSTHSPSPFSLAHHLCRVWLGKPVWFYG